MAQFEPGKSGNPAGRKPGTPNRVNAALRAILADQGPALLAKAIAMAGDEPTVMVALLNRLVPALKPEGVAAPLAVDATRAPAEQSRQVLAEIVAGRIAIDEGHALIATIERRAAIEHQDDIARVVAQLAMKAGIELPATLAVRAASHEGKGNLQ